MAALSLESLTGRLAILIGGGTLAERLSLRPGGSEGTELTASFYSGRPIRPPSCQSHFRHVSILAGLVPGAAAPPVTASSGWTLCWAGEQGFSGSVLPSLDKQGFLEASVLGSL